MNYKMNFKEI